MKNSENITQLAEIQAFTSQIKNLLAQSRTKAAIEQLSAYENPLLNQNQLIQLANRWENNESDYIINGILEREEYLLERNKIVNALLAILDKMYRTAEAKQDESKKSPNNEASVTVPSSLPKVPNKVFLMYDRMDARYSQRLVMFLSLLKRHKKIELFDMHKDVSLGKKKEETWLENLKTSALVLCIVTVNFMWGDTYELAEKAEQMGLVLVPVLVNEVDLEDSPLHGKVSLPSDERFVAQWESEDAAYRDISIQIREYFEQLAAQ